MKEQNSGVISIRFKTWIYLTALMIGVICILVGIVQFTMSYSEHKLKDSLIVAGFVPFNWMIFLIGGIIILTLTYVSWRKYKGHKQRMKNRNN